MPEPIRWGLLAAGGIARAFAKGVEQSDTGEVVAVGSRSQDKANAFAVEFNIPRAHGSYEALLADPDIDAIYISTPHPQHGEWAIKAAEAGKHILVEKPIDINQQRAEEMLKAARNNNVFLMEAYMYRCHPQAIRLVELIRNGLIGDVRVIQATFSFHATFDANSRIWSNALAGGGILDVGGYTTSISRLIAGAALGTPFADPIAVTGAGHLHPETGVDAWAVGTLQFEGDIIAQLSCGVGVTQESVVRVFGSKGHLLLPKPYCSSHDSNADGMLVVYVQGRQPEEICVPSAVTSFAHEADVCGDAIREGRQQAESPAMSWDDTLGNIKAQDAWRAAIGLTYEAEKQQKEE